MTTYVATRRNRLTGEEYHAVCYRLGFNEYEVSIVEGRPCIVTGSFRCRPKGRALHTRYEVRFVDNGECRTIPAGRWAKIARIPSLTEA
jgi:hypothetical protein